jgi:hypothetical protein
VNLICGNSIFVFAIIILSVSAAFPNSSRAQQIAPGEFSLSQQVRSGSSVLPAGDYVYWVDLNRWPAAARREQKGGGFSGMFAPKAFSRPSKHGLTGIALGTVGHDSYVASFYLRGQEGEPDFSAPGAEGRRQPGDATPAHEAGESSILAAGYLTILNPSHEKMSQVGAESVYLRACQAVEKEFHRPNPIRPRWLLRLGASGKIVRYPMREIQFKERGENRFADAVADLSLHDRVSHEQRSELGSIAVQEAGAPMNICDLKACVK